MCTHRGANMTKSDQIKRRHSTLKTSKRARFVQRETILSTGGPATPPPVAGEMNASVACAHPEYISQKSQGPSTSLVQRTELPSDLGTRISRSSTYFLAFFLQANVLGMTLNPSHTSDLGSPCHSWYHVAMHSDALISCPCSRSVQTQICAYGRKGPWTHGVNSARQLGLQCHHLRGASAYGRQRPAWQAHAKATRQVYQCSATNYSTEAMWMAALARMI